MTARRLPLRADPRRLRLLTFFLLGVMLAAGIGLRDPWPADEPRFMLVAKTMVESGDWLIPQRGVELYPDKPPLFMWAQAASYQVIGNWRIAFLLPSLLAGLLTLWLVFDLARRHASERAALLATALTALTFQFTFQFKGAQIDPLLVALVTLGCYGLCRHLIDGPRWGWYVLAWIAVALGIMAKGVGFLALFLLLPYLLLRWRAPHAMPHIGALDWRWLLGPLALLLTLSLWLGPLFLRVWASDEPRLDAYLNNILFSQTVERYLDPWHHAKPGWYFIEVLLTAWQPAGLLLLAALPALWRRARAGRVDPYLWLPFGMWAATMVFFSLSPGKRDMYILPALPMLAVALAPLLPGLLRLSWLRWALWLLTLALSIGLAGMALAAWFGSPGFEVRLADSRGIDPWPLAFAMGAIGIALAAWLRPRRGPLVFAGMVWSMWMLWGLVGYPLLDGARSARDVMQQAGRIIGPDAELALVGWREQNYLQADRAVADFGFKRPKLSQLGDAIGWLDAAPSRRWVFARDEELSPCIDLALATNIGQANRRTWYLFQADAVTDACRRDGPGQGTAPPAPDGRLDRRSGEAVR